MLDIRSFQKHLPASLQGKSESITFLALAGSVSLALVSIAASEILLALAIAGFIWVLKRNKGFIPPGMQILLPLVFFMTWTLVAAFASSNVTLSLQGAKKFFLFLLVPVVPLVVRGQGRVRWIYKAIFLVAVFSSLKGLAQFASNPNRDLLHRISGFMSQWMTYSGLLMLALVLLVAYGFSEGIRKHMWMLPVAAFIFFALLFSQTRSAWGGAIAGITVVLILMRRPRALILLFTAVLACYLLFPSIRERLQSALDPTDPNTQNRIELVRTSMRLIQHNPWFGVGPKNVNQEALKYRGQNEYPDWMYQHMHNNFLQIAAETGIPGLILWLWFMGRLARDAWGCYRYARSGLFAWDDDLEREALMASTAALAAWVALMVAGMFEYNFGDSEILVLFLFIVSAPYGFAAVSPEMHVLESKGTSALNPEP